MRSRVVLAIVVVVLAGCGSSSSGKPSASPTTPPTTARTAPNTPAQLAADRALARRVVLRLSDLPRGYKLAKDQGGSASGDNVPSAVSRRFATCAHLPPDAAKALLSNDPPPGVIDVESKSFEVDPDVLSQLTISGGVDFGRSPSDVAQFLTILDSAKSPGCWSALFRALSTSEKGTTFGQVSVAPSGSLHLGDRSGGLDAHIVVSASGVSVPVYLSVVAAQRGRVVVAVVATGAGIYALRSLQRALLQKMLGRLDAAGV